MSSLLKDLRHGARALRRSPGFTVATVLALALGIGANTALFSVVSALLLRPLPLLAPERLVAVSGFRGDENPGSASLSRPDFEDLRQKVKSFGALTAFDVGGLAMTGGGHEPERVQAAMVTADFFRTAGVPPALGRALTDEEQVLNGPRSVVLSHALWTRRFGADPSALGQSLELEGEPYTVVGVMPKGFDFPREGANEAVELWAPLFANAFVRSNWENRGSHFLSAIGRLAPGATVEQARAEATTLMSTLEREYPETNTRQKVAVEGLQERLSAGTRRPALLLLGAVALLLLVACVNVAQLLLARALARQHEFAVRTALGAGRGALVRQLLAEGSLLAFAGGALGLLLGAWGVDVLGTWAPSAVRGVQAVRIDGLALAYTLALVVGVAMLCGLAPLGTAAGAGFGGLLRGSRGASAGRGALRWRAVLASTQVALALVLLSGAGLLVRSAQRLSEVDPGYRAENVTLLRINLPEKRYEDATIGPFFSTLLEQVRALPGIESAAWMTPGVVSGGGIRLGMQLPERPTPAGSEPSVSYRAVSDGAFPTLGIPVRRGRDFTPRDDARAPDVLIVNEAFARKHFPGEEVLGKRVIIGYGDDEKPREVVGVVGDVRGRSLDQVAEPEVYAPMSQTPWATATLLVRSRLSAEQVEAAVKPEVHRLDSLLPLAATTTLEQRLEQTVADRRFQRILLAVFALTALALASQGIYGLMAYSVAQRKRELGIRLALGAQPRDVVRLVLGQALRLCGVGLVAGMLLALALSRVLEGLLYDVSATDPLTFVSVPLLLLAVVTVASWLPARGASRLSPGVAMSPD